MDEEDEYEGETRGAVGRGDSLRGMKGEVVSDFRESDRSMLAVPMGVGDLDKEATLFR